ncbi:MAG: SDR family oxidoreductase [Candidatus Heimdallarchaeota archaeon]|nr:MAG: SDR family oxidoreductase [Candidatus Heimdallarchaeota archaeon]
MDTTRKTAIITGASKGIGRAISLNFATNNIDVVLAARNKNQLQQVHSEIEKINIVRSVIVPTDVTNEKQVKNLVETTIDQFGKVDILVNNAGVGRFKRADEFKLADYHYMFDVNVKGVFLVTKYVVPHMLARESGQIINIASIAGKTGFKTGTLYSASKYAVVGYTWSLREDLKEHKIKVSVICPGSVVTAFGKKQPERVEWSMEPEDVAHACNYLVSESDTVNTAEIIIKPRYNPRTIDWKRRRGKGK